MSVAVVGSTFEPQRRTLRARRPATAQERVCQERVMVTVTAWLLQVRRIGVKKEAAEPTLRRSRAGTISGSGR
jgi:hypothetical protein